LKKKVNLLTSIVNKLKKKNLVSASYVELLEMVFEGSTLEPMKPIVTQKGKNRTQKSHPPALSPDPTILFK